MTWTRFSARTAPGPKVRIATAVTLCVEGDAELVADGSVCGDVVVAAAEIVHECMAGGENPR